MDDGAFSVSDRSYTHDVATAAIKKAQGRKAKDDRAVERFRMSSVKAAAPLQFAAKSREEDVAPVVVLKVRKRSSKDGKKKKKKGKKAAPAEAAPAPAAATAAPVGLVDYGSDSD